MKGGDSHSTGNGGGPRHYRADRGQTMQDYVVGMSIFIIAFMFVLAMFPGLLMPFESSIDGRAEADASQVTGEIVSNLSLPAQPNVLNATELRQTVFNKSKSVSQLKSTFGLDDVSLNVSLLTLNGAKQVNSTGAAVPKTSTAVSTRIVAVDYADCVNGCRLIVRTW